MTKLNVKFRKISFYDEATLDIDQKLLKKDPRKRLGSNGTAAIKVGSVMGSIISFNEVS